MGVVAPYRYKSLGYPQKCGQSLNCRISPFFQARLVALYISIADGPCRRPNLDSQSVVDNSPKDFSDMSDFDQTVAGLYRAAAGKMNHGMLRWAA